jgi:hypothetical protein
MYLDVAAFRRIVTQPLLPARAEPHLSCFPCVAEPPMAPYSIIRRTSDEVDVLRYNEWQALLCRITGRTCRVVGPYALALPACH